MRGLEWVLVLRTSDWWEIDEEKQRRAGTGDLTIHLSLILCMIPSLCLSCNIPLSPRCACLCFHSLCLCLAVLYLLSFQPPPLPFSCLLCVFIQRSSSQKASLSSFFLLFYPHPPTFHPSTMSDFLLLKAGNIKETETCQVCVWVCNWHRPCGVIFHRFSKQADFTALGLDGWVDVHYRWMDRLGKWKKVLGGRQLPVTAMTWGMESVLFEKREEDYSQTVPSSLVGQTFPADRIFNNLFVGSSSKMG